MSITSLSCHSSSEGLIQVGRAHGFEIRKGTKGYAAVRGTLALRWFDSIQSAAYYLQDFGRLWGGNPSAPPHTPRSILRELPLREEAAQCAEFRRRPVGQLRNYPSELSAPAIEIMRERVRRRKARQVAEAARTSAPGRILGLAERKRLERGTRLAAAVASILAEARPLNRAKKARIMVGKPAGIVEDNTRYSKSWHRRYGPSVYRLAGARYENGRIIVENSDGEVVFDARVANEDLLDPDLDARAQRILGIVSDEDLDAVGPAGGVEGLIGPRPRFLVCRSDFGLMIADHPTKPTIAQVVVRDATTGRRHILSVPPRFAKDRYPSANDRVRAAIAWTFGKRQYRPDVEA